MFFFSSLGGLQIKIIFFYQPTWLTNCSFFLSNFTVAGSSTILKKIDIELDFKKKTITLPEIQKTIYHLHEAEIVVAENGHFVLHRTCDSNKLLSWVIFINFEFSYFEYNFSLEATEPIDIFQLAFNRFLLQHTFINHHGLIIHAAGGSINGKGIVFPAVSGTGKSTLSHLLLSFPENQFFSEERIIMRRLNDGWHLWGTPWQGTGSIARNESAPLSALVFLSQAPETKIKPLSTSLALHRLLETVSIPWYSQEWTDKGLAVCESLLRDIPAFELAFRPDETAVQAVSDFAASLS